MPIDSIVNNRFNGMEEDYARVADFVQRRRKISYGQLDSSILRDVNLFALPENFDFVGLDRAAEVIIASLPAIKRIFAKPITHIKTTSEILPVESVQKINNETVIHAAVHSELWENITVEGLKPRKLLTEDHRDNYAIYENLVFAKAIDMILSFVSKNIHFLNEVLYANRDLQFNLLERENHLSYFLAIGKLHTGYIRDYEKYTALAENCLDKLLFIDRVIRSRLATPVYKYCKNSGGKLTLKKTNIFRMHKDYHKVYLLVKWFSESMQEDANNKTPQKEISTENYRLFCTLLSVFAAGHFNFSFLEGEMLDLKNLDAKAEYLGWKLRIESLDFKGIKPLRFTFAKDKVYRIMLLPEQDFEKGKKHIESLMRKVEANEFLVALPMDESDKAVQLSLYDIESFRRIQQILLKGMIYSDSTHSDCAFCGSEMIETEEGWECSRCRTKIFERKCPKSQERYFATTIKHFTPKVLQDDSSRAGRYINHKKAEAAMNFRNITKISESGDLICPLCDNLHVE